jgi:hypothetical protein
VIQRYTALHEARVEAVRFELSSTPRSGKQSALIHDWLDIDDVCPGQSRLDEVHEVDRF